MGMLKISIPQDWGKMVTHTAKSRLLSLASLFKNNIVLCRPSLGKTREECTELQARVVRLRIGSWAARYGAGRREAGNVRCVAGARTRVFFSPETIVARLKGRCLRDGYS